MPCTQHNITHACTHIIIRTGAGKRGRGGEDGEGDDDDYDVREEGGDAPRTTKKGARDRAAEHDDEDEEEEDENREENPDYREGREQWKGRGEERVGYEDEDMEDGEEAGGRKKKRARGTL